MVVSLIEQTRLQSCSTQGGEKENCFQGNKICRLSGGYSHSVIQIIGEVVEILFYFPIPSSLVMSLVKLNCMVLCHGNSVRVTGSFLLRSCSATRMEELQPIQTSNKKLKWPTITIG